MEAKLGLSIPLNVFGSGFSIAHVGSIVVSPRARIGMNCRIHVGVNIGTRTGVPDEAPTIRDNVYIGPGPSSSAPLRSQIASPSKRSRDEQELRDPRHLDRWRAGEKDQ